METVEVGELSYNRNDVIGRGSYGNVVHKGFHLSKPVAIKRMQRVYGKNKYGQDESAIQLREVELMKTAKDHPNILRVIRTEMNDDFLFIATQLCRGTLEDYVKKNYKRSFEGFKSDTINVLFQITQGLAYLHSLGIVHRDIKPINILIFVPDGRGSKPVIKLADFGISKKLEADNNDFTNTSVTNPNGARGWVPPEVYKEKRFGFKVDVWALGCIFAYTLCEGKHPFGEDVDKRIYLIRKEKAMLMEKEDMKFHYPWYSQAIPLIKSMLRTDPSKRPKVENVLKHPFFIPLKELPKYFKELWSSFKDSVTNDQKVKLEKTLPDLEVGHEIVLLNTPLHILCKYCDNDDLIDLIKILIEKGADVNAENKFGEIPLHFFCNNRFKSNQNFNRTDIFQLLIENGADVNDKDVDDRTPLHLLFKNAKDNDLVDIVRLLREKGADVMAKDIFGDTPLHVLCGHRKNDNMIDYIKFLTEESKYRAGADVMAKDVLGDTPLHVLCRHRKNDNMIAYIKLLTEESKYGAGADVNVQNNRRETSLHVLCEYYQKDDLKDILKFLIKKCNVNVNVMDKDGNTPLHFLCEYYNHDNLINIIQLFVQNGAEVNTKNSAGLTPLLWLCKNYNHDNLINIVQLFVQNGAEVNTKNSAGLTPLLWLCENYNHDNLINIVQLFVQNGAEVNTKNSVGLTPLLWLCENYNHDNLINIVQLLVQNGAEVNAKGKYGNTPLHSLCENYIHDNFIHIVQLLVDNGAEVNIRDNYGNTPLHKVLRNSSKFSKAIIQILLNRGADVNAGNIDGWTPLHSLCLNYKNDNQIDIVQLLINKDAKVNAQDNNGNTQLHILCRNYPIRTNGNVLRNLRSIVVLFEKCGASMDAKNNEGMTPNDYLIRNKIPINMLAMEDTNRVAIDDPKNPITKDEDTTECPTDTAKSTEALPAQVQLAGPSRAPDGGFIRPGTSRKRKRINHSTANVHQNSVQLSNTVPPEPAAAVEPAVLPFMLVSETASNPQLNQDSFENQHLNTQHYGPSTTSEEI